MDAERRGGRGAREGRDPGEEVRLELDCAMRFPGCGIAGEDYELIGRELVCAGISRKKILETHRHDS